MYITVLCRVVDNYGDIGLAWRMCRRLAKIQSQYKICLLVDDFETFSKIEHNGLLRRYAPRNDGAVPVIASEAWQSIVIDGVEIFHWHDETLCHEVFSKNDGERLQIILELFQCGRPDWMEKLLFEEKLKRTVQIIMIDYLTAEKYAEDFHCLKSLTRSARVQKVNFMPGFTERTGGLIIDDEWREVADWNEGGPILVFTYTMGVGLIENAGALSNDTGALSLSKGQILKPLPYMNQTNWDRMMKKCSALIIRGEESMSRACLSGIPFIWQAYPQTEEYQMVKVRALLERMRPHFAAEDFEIVEKAWININNTLSLSGLTRQSHHERDSRGKPENDSNAMPENDSNAMPENAHSTMSGSLSLSKGPYEQFFSNLKSLRPGFVSFAQSLRKNGDLCTNLMTFINKIDIIYR